MFDALLFFLGGCHVCFEQVQIVSVSTEDTLVVHDVESISIIFIFVFHGIGVGISELLLALDDFGLGSLKGLGHFKICSFIEV